MNLGTFSISLAVKDITASRAFYEKLGFEEVAGELGQNWIILQNGTTTIGLFQGMLEKNTMTFNPGADYIIGVGDTLYAMGRPNQISSLRSRLQEDSAK